MSLKWSLPFLLSLLPVASFLFAQAPVINFDHLTPADGLSNSDVMDILQDRRGFIWLATRHGLNRYDGHSFKKYYAAPEDSTGLSGNWLNSIAEDSVGNIWISTYQKGVCRLDPATGTFTQFHHIANDSNSLTTETLPETLQLYVDQSGMVWVPTHRSLERIHPVTGNIQHFPYRICLLQDKQGDHWFWSDSSLTRVNFNRKEKSVFPLEPQEDGLVPNAMAMTEIGDGRYWVSSRSHGLFQLNTAAGTLQRIPFPSETDSPSKRPTGIRQMDMDTEGRLWMASEGNGLFVLLPGESIPHHLTHDPLQPSSIANNMVQSILVDRRGRLWVGTEGGGLDTWHPHALTYEYFQHNPYDPHSLSHNNVTAVYEDDRNNLWVGTWGGGLNYLDRRTGKFTHYLPDPTDPRSIPSKYGVNIFETPDGTPLFEFWVPNTGFRTVYFEGGKFKRLQIEDDRITSLVRDSPPPFVDSKGIQWHRLQERDGLLRFNPQTGEKDFFDVPGEAFFEDSRGNLWIAGGAKGLLLFQPADKTFLHFSTAASADYQVGADRVYNFFEDSRGNLWLGSKASGLIRLKTTDGSFESSQFRSATSGLPGDAVTGVQEDQRGYLWIGTNQGISRFDPKTAQFKNFPFLEGQASVNWWNPSQGKDGHLFFGCSNGLFIIHPESVQANEQPPEVFLTDFQLHEQPVAIDYSHDDASAPTSPLEKDILFSKEISLAHHQNDFSITFAALNYTDPMRNRYRYRLSGYEEEWKETGADRPFATYTNLSHGSYHFEVIGINNDGVPGSRPAILSITITPPLWQTGWAYALCLLLVVSILYGAYRYQAIRQAKKAEAKRQLELHAFKARFYTNITHEFRTPLTVILGMTDRIAEEPQRWFREGLTMIHRNGRQLLRLVDQLLDLSRIEAGGLKMKIIHSDVVPFLGYLTESFHSWAEVKNIRLSFYAEDNHVHMDFDPLRLQQVVSNLLFNALKYTPERGKVAVGVHKRPSTLGLNDRSDGMLEIKIKDNGPGIPSDQLERIFDRFYQGQGNNTERRKEGVGIGLAFARELVQLMDGKIDVQSKEGEGSTFIIQLPIREQGERRKAAYPEFESPMPPSVRNPELSAAAADNVSNDEAQAAEEKELLLIVEDNLDVITYLRSCLSAHYRIVEAHDGKEGLLTAFDEIPDVIISDIMMPALDGFGLLQRLKKDIRTSHIPVILLTAKSDRDSRLEGLETGADAYLDKPFDADELLIRIRSLISTRRMLQQYYRQLNPVASPSEKHFFKTEDPFIEEIRTIIEEHLDDELFGARQLAQAANLSRMQLHRKLKALTNHSAIQVIHIIRLQHARQLLQTTDLRVGEVADRVGFKDPSYFTKLYKETFHELPSQLEKNKEEK